MIVLPLRERVVGGGWEEFKDWLVKLLRGMYKDVSFPSFVGLTMIGIVVFVGLVVLNVLGLFPFIFSVTSHLSVSFSLGMVM